MERVLLTGPQALEAMRTGLRVRRDGWPEDRWVEGRPGLFNFFRPDRHPFVHVPWETTEERQEVFLKIIFEYLLNCDDWVVLDEPYGPEEPPIGG